MTVSKLFKTSKKTSISGDNHRTTTDKPAFKRTPLQKSHSLPSPLSDHSLLTSRRIDLDLKNVKDSSTLTDFEALKLLRAFDVDSKYGNTLGLTRLERYERAEKLGLSPPKEVGQIVRDEKRIARCKTQQQVDELKECLWYTYKDIFK